jgi:hypothetical protein
MKKEIFMAREVSQILRTKMKDWSSAVTVYNREIRDEADLVGEFRACRFQSGHFRK